nr:hypothetical protein [Salinibacter ruber]
MYIHYGGLWVLGDRHAGGTVILMAPENGGVDVVGCAKGRGGLEYDDVVVRFDLVQGMEQCIHAWSIVLRQLSGTLKRDLAVVLLRNRHDFFVVAGEDELVKVFQLMPCLDCPGNERVCSQFADVFAEESL